MPIEPDGPAPYAPPATVILTIEWHRERGLPTPITTEVIARVIESEGLAPRVMKALRLFELVDDAGNATATFEELAKAPTDEDFKARLAAVVSSAYADALQYIKPESATLEQIEGQFRRYTPRGQRERMVVLFRGMCLYTGIIPRTGEEVRAESVPRQRRAKPALAREKERDTETTTTQKSAPKPKPLETPILPITSPSDDAKSRYIALLLDQATENPSPELFDRIEKVLGIDTTTSPAATGRGHQTEAG